MSERISIIDLEQRLELATRGSNTRYWAGYESGRAHVWASAGTGRRTVVSGTARECAMFIEGMREGIGIGYNRGRDAATS